ncbi:MAG: hypothetical protein J0L73_21940 [Verrucomicrobia bacterium]|nr:hypothetical protein [Verrucomicrobiota bacterium]
MSIRRHLFPLVGSFILMADIPPPNGPKPVPPSSPGCTMHKAGRMAQAVEAAKNRKA